MAIVTWFVTNLRHNVRSECVLKSKTHESAKGRQYFRDEVNMLQIYVIFTKENSDHNDNELKI